MYVGTWICKFSLCVVVNTVPNGQRETVILCLVWVDYDSYCCDAVFFQVL